MATEKDRVNTGALATIAAVLALSILGIALMVTALVRTTEEEENGTLSEYSRKPFDDLAAEQQSALTTGPAWNKKGETASLPIDRAMALVVTRISSDPNAATPPQPPPDAGADAESAADQDGGAEGGEADGGTTDETADGAPAETDAAPAESDAGAIDKPPKTPKPAPPTGGAPEPAPPAPPPAPPPEEP
jgi:hypothetical protein